MSNLKKTILGFSTAVCLSGAMVIMPIVVQADTVSDLQAQIASLLAQITQLQTQLTTLQGGTTVPAGYTFSANLKQGSTGTDVTNLQTVLKSDSSIYPEGLVTGYFGALTKAAVIKFQNKYASEILTPLGLTAGTGYVGAATRVKLNALYGGGVVITPTTPTTPTVGTGLTLSSAIQPSATIAPGSAARLPFTKVTFTAGTDGDVVVSGVNVERTGLAVDAVFSGVVLLDENGQQLGIAKTFNSNHQLTVGDSFTVKAGQSRTMTIAGNMATLATLTSYAGQVAYLSVTGANTSATVSGVLPITGAGHTINGTLAIGSATVARGATDPGTNQASKEVGATGYTFSAIRVTAGSAEKIRIKSIRWNQSGSAAATDLANLKTIVDGTSYDVVVSSDGKYYTSTFGDGIVIDKGNNSEISIKGDIAGGSARTIEFDVYKNTDLYVAGETYGYGITPPVGASTATATARGVFQATNPWYAAWIVTVSNGTLNVDKASAVAADNVAINLSNQPLGGFTVEAKGEAITVGQMVFRLSRYAGSGAAASTQDITNISLVDENGTVVAGPVDVAASAATVTFTDTVTFPIGKKTYTLKGKLGTDFQTNDTIAASTTPSTDWTLVTGQTTGNTITPSPSSIITANTMTVKSTSLAISVSGDPVAQTVVSGGRFAFANYRFDATASGEDVRMSSVPLAYFAASGTPSNLTSCQLYDGLTAITSGSNIVNPTFVWGTTGSSTTFTFDGTGLTIPKGTIKSLSLSCSIAAATSTGAIYMWGVDTGATFAGTGLTSGQSFTPTATENGGQQITVTTGGTLAVTLDTSSPSYTIATAGSTGVPLTALKFHAATEALSLQKISLVLTNTASSSVTDLTQVTLWDGATQVGTAVFTTGAYATSTLTTPVLISKDGDKVITIKGDLSAIGTSLPGTEGALIAVDWNNSDSTGTYGIGQNSGTTVYRTSGSNSASNGVRMFKAQPIFAKLSVPTTNLAAGDMDIYRFSVKADSSSGNGIGIYQFTVNIATSTGAAASGYQYVKDLKIYGYTDSAFSSPVSGYANGLLYATSSTAVSTGIIGNGNSTTTLEVSDTVTPLQIPAGLTYYFRVQGTVSITAGTSVTSGLSVTTKISGDSAYPALPTLMASTTNLITTGGINIKDAKFAWSPNATTTSTTSHVDWTNGYYVSGLPSTGMDSVTLTK